MIVYISAGNSDDKLTQRDWALLQTRIVNEIRQLAHIHGNWYSAPHAAFQNMCVCAEMTEASAGMLKATMAELASQFRPDSIAWAEVPSTEFLGS